MYILIENNFITNFKKRTMDPRYVEVKNVTGLPLHQLVGLVHCLKVDEGNLKLTGTLNKSNRLEVFIEDSRIRTQYNDVYDPESLFIELSNISAIEEITNSLQLIQGVVYLSKDKLHLVNNYDERIKIRP